MNLFITEIDMAKQELDQKKHIPFPFHHGKLSGISIFIRSIIFRLEKFKEKIDKLYFIDDEIKAPAYDKYSITVKQLESRIKEEKLALWKEDNKLYEDPSMLSRAIEAVTILRRPD